MNQNKTYFEKIKQECIKECGMHSLEEIAEGMFDKKEIIDLFSAQEKTDEAYSFIINLMSEHFFFEQEGNIYLPGTGVGGLARRIMNTFPNMFVLQVDNSSKMVSTNKKASTNYTNTSIQEANILDFELENNSLNAVIAYGVMRYVPELERNNLVSKWSSSLINSGITVLGEGIAKQVIEDISSNEYSSGSTYERDANLFRCSLFYLLFNRYSRDNEFQDKVLKTASNNESNYSEVLKDIASFIPGKVYAKVLQK